MSDGLDEPKARLTRVLDGLDLLIYGGLGAAIFAYALCEIAVTVFESGSGFAIAVVTVVIVGSITTIAMDVRRRRMGFISRLLLVGWAVCVAIVVFGELFDSFS